MRRILVSILLIAAPAADAYIRLYFPEAGVPVPLRRPDNRGIQFYLNSQVVAGATSSVGVSNTKVVSDSSDPAAAARAALATWNAVGADIRFLPLQSTSLQHDRNDGRNVITIANKDDLSLLGYASPQSPGAIAVTDNSWYTSGGTLASGIQVQKGDLADSDIVLNPSFSFSTDLSTGYDLQVVLTHELGHALGADHSGIVGATMFQGSTVIVNNVAGANLNQRLLSADELAFASAVYPVPGTSVGTIAGKVAASDGNAIQRALVTAVDTSSGAMVGALTGSDGSYSIPVPSGSYLVYAEPLNGIVGKGNIVSFYVDLGATVNIGFQPTFLGSVASPTLVPVVAGASAGANITVAPVAAGLTLPRVGYGSVNGKSDITSVFQILGPKVIASGQSFDIGMLGGGVDASTTIRLIGAGATVRAGSVRADASVNFTEGQLIRATIDVPTRQTPALASLVLTKGNTVVATGMFVIVPPTPTFVSKGVVSAGSFLGANGDGVVTPGGLATIFDIPNAPNLGPGSFVQPTEFDAYGKLPTTLAGVTVTFDGKPAPVFLAWNQQLNVQVPFEVAGQKSTLVQIDYLGSRSAAVSVPVAASQPALFVYPGGAIAGNQDGSLNTASNAAARGSVISLYGTGLGKLAYDVQTGVGAPGPPVGYSGGHTCVLGGSKSVPVAFAGWTPSAVGLAQWSFVVPADSPTGTVSVKCSDANGASTQTDNIFIQ